MIAQVFWIKGRVETMRTHNSFGMLLWQLNENWPTGGWGCIEYGPQRGKEQYEMGGRWKPIMYLLKRSLFQDVTMSCGEDNLCFVVNDGAEGTTVTINVTAWALSDPLPKSNFTLTLDLQPRELSFFSIPDSLKIGADIALAKLDGKLSVDEAFLWKTPKDLPLDNGATVSVSLRHTTGKEQGPVILDVKSDRLVLYVWLSTMAKGTFSDNAFHLRPGEQKTILFMAMPGDDSPINIPKLRQSLRISHLGTYQESQQRKVHWATEHDLESS